ncbi:LIM domain-containing protein PLIM2c [Heracleum sosnowskyi]|uniref:LIM domain-containing protein PLIM2c n=1 Tax=Heracleum sosnowskyi TaxID=360622 RepID=A0AAD8GQN2_9APIA|nr:LIM domain-containing protein PLIM2c [Heracleum sosnowskyi]
MAFTGTTQKCKACDKTVYFVEMVSADGIPYHQNCFRCSNCNGKLSISTYHSLEGTLFCKPHFEQHTKENGIVPKITPNNGKDMWAKTPSRLAGMFSGTQEKCTVCKKTVYPLEKVTVEGDFFHKKCFKCAHGGCSLTPSNYAALDGIVYCKPHFSQLFKEKGSYSTLNKTSAKKNESDSEETTAGDDANEKPAEAEQEA